MQFLTALNEIDWSDQERSCDQSQDFLKSMYGRKDGIRNLISDAEREPALRSKCEKYDLLTKLVLFEADTGARLRLHIFHGGYFDRPHNHRWLYTSNILKGSYTQKLFKSGKDFLESGVKDLELVFSETRSENTPYSLNTNIFHSITASKPVVTLIVRGPSTNSEFRVMDRNTGTSWNQKGAADESAEERKQKYLTDEEFSRAVATLEGLGVL